jgi:hypothetical protein
LFGEPVDGGPDLWGQKVAELVVPRADVNGQMVGVVQVGTVGALPPPLPFPRAEQATELLLEAVSRIRLRNYLQDPDPQIELRIWTRFRNRSGKKFQIKNRIFYLIKMLIYV